MVAMRPTKTSPVAPSMLISSPAVDDDVAADEHALLGAHLDLLSAGDAGLAEAARHDGGVAGGAASGSQHTLGGDEAVDVVRAGLRAHQHHADAPSPLLRGLVGGEDDPAGCAARGGPKADGDELARLRGGLLGVLVQPGEQQLVDLVRLHAHQSLVLGDEALLVHVDGHLDGRLPAALGGAGLQQEELALLDGELHVLGVPVMPLQLVGHGVQLLVDVRHLVLELGDFLGRRDAGHHILALGVDEVLAVEAALAGGWVTREEDARAAAVVHVAEDHGDDAHGGVEVVGDPVVVAIVDGSGASPSCRRPRGGRAQAGTWACPGRARPSPG